MEHVVFCDITENHPSSNGVPELRHTRELSPYVCAGELPGQSVSSHEEEEVVYNLVLLLLISLSLHLYRLSLSTGR